MYSISFTLKQHTPLIHFQHNQDGATLRATEVKPKLDRYLIKFMKIQGKQIPLKWMVGKKKRDDGGIALDYKINIESKGNKSEFAITSNPVSNKKDEGRKKSLMDTISAEYINETQYFADNQFIDNISMHSKIRKGIMYESIILSFFSFNEELIEVISANFPAFIVSQNFGTRQTKGFGCFSIDGRTDDQILMDLKKVPDITGIFRKTNGQSFQQKLQLIAKNYSVIKRGKSYGGYQKSKLWEHFCLTKKIRWEKRKIKLHIKNTDLGLFNQLKYETSINRIDDCNVGTDSDANNYMYIRALLGLAEQYEFVKSDFTRFKVKIKDTLHNNSSEKEFAIDRFRSPIRYYVTENSIFLITEEINPLIHSYQNKAGNTLDREFEFTIDNLKSNKSFTLKVPKQFELTTFIQNKGEFGNNLKEKI